MRLKIIEPSARLASENNNTPSPLSFLLVLGGSHFHLGKLLIEV